MPKGVSASYVLLWKKRKNKYNNRKGQGCAMFGNYIGTLIKPVSVLDTVEICPVAFEIFERLKKEYGLQNVIC